MIYEMTINVSSRFDEETIKDEFGKYFEEKGWKVLGVVVNRLKKTAVVKYEDGTTAAAKMMGSGKSKVVFYKGDESFAALFEESLSRQDMR